MIRSCAICRVLMVEPGQEEVRAARILEDFADVLTVRGYGCGDVHAGSGCPAMFTCRPAGGQSVSVLIPEFTRCEDGSCVATIVCWNDERLWRRLLPGRRVVYGPEVEGVCSCLRQYVECAVGVEPIEWITVQEWANGGWSRRISGLVPPGTRDIGVP
jgi:hypothetical protein